MAIQPDTGGTGGGPDGPPWDQVFTPSELGAGVFDVRWDLRPRLRRWLADHDLPFASGREPHRPAVDAWALLDGGVIAVSAVTLPGAAPGTILTPGMRVIGFRTLRLLSGRLGLVGPSTALRGEHLDVPGLVDDLFDARRVDAEAVEQAELLATGTDRSSLRWVVTALRV